MRLITLPDYDVCTYEPPENVYGILAAPPCTEFSVAKGSRPRDLKSGMEIVQACLDIIWACRIQQKLHFWAMENPRGLLRQFLGIPNFTFEQWQYGGNKRKATDIWGYYKKPVPSVKAIPESMSIKWPNGRANARDWAKIPCPPEICQLHITISRRRQKGGIESHHPAGIRKGIF